MNESSGSAVLWGAVGLAMGVLLGSMLKRCPTTTSSSGSWASTIGAVATFLKSKSAGEPK